MSSGANNLYDRTHMKNSIHTTKPTPKSHIIAEVKRQSLTLRYHLITDEKLSPCFCKFPQKTAAPTCNNSRLPPTAIAAALPTFAVR